MGGEARVPPPPPALSARPALRAWLLGTALVALVVVVARAVDKCLHLKLAKSRRRSHDSQEWQTPNVCATNLLMVDNGTVIIPGLEDAEPFPADICDTVSLDLPPPYSECTDADSTGPTSIDHNKVVSDILTEEPPPYSDCYVEFSNKNGLPSVLIFSRKRTPLVNRREIVGSEMIVIDDEITTEQNTESTNTEIANEGAKIEECNDDLNYYTLQIANNDDRIMNLNMPNTEGSSGTNASKPAVAINDGENTQDRVAHLLV